jgi:hypothetical protein
MFGEYWQQLEEKEQMVMWAKVMEFRRSLENVQEPWVYVVRFVAHRGRSDLTVV